MEITIENFFQSMFGNILISISSLYCWYKLSNNKKTMRKYIFTTLIISFVMTFVNFYIPNPLKIIIMIIVLIAIDFLYFNRELKFALIEVVISEMILAFLEFLYVIVCFMIFGDSFYNIIYKPIPFIILNLYLLVGVCFVSSRKFIYNLYLLFSKSKNNNSAIYSLIVIVVLLVATVESYVKMPFVAILFVNVSMAVIFISIVIMSEKTINAYDDISKKYQTSVSSLKEFEIVIDKFGMITHENKNEFQTIRNMLKAGEDVSYVVTYIDKLIDNKIKDNVKIMKQTSKIPNGGLRTIIYSKLCRMDSLKIKYKLRISKDVHTTDLINIDEELTLKTCKILGVFLDNAIDAVENLNNKQIIIEIYIMDEFLCIDITNNFKGDLDLNKICGLKYTTKGEGHGYGLPLVNQILNEEPDNLLNEKSINGDTFTQTLKIKM